MPHQTEPSANNAMGYLLQAMLPRSNVRSENTRAIAGHPGLQPDILITAPGSSPVVIEAEYMPAANVEAEARQRLGLETTAYGRVIEAAIALRYPSEVGEAHDLHSALSAAQLSYCVFTENGGASRFPDSGWLDGSVEDLADMVRLVSVPQHAVDRATTALQQGIDGAAKFLDEIDQTRPGITNEIAALLGMANVLQTRRMACAIIANALVFHDQIAGMHARIKSLALACGDNVANPQGEVLAAWTAILNINYWPIFAIAKDILQHLDSADAARILRRLRNTAQAVNATGVENAHDLTGRIFQRLIADRKYLATFYTLPASAALLARLAVAKLEGVDWSSAEEIGQPARRRLRLWHRRLALCRLRSDRRPPRTRRRQCGQAAPGDDGGGPLRLRRHAVCHTHHGLHALRRRTRGRLQQLPPLHNALRPSKRWRRDDRLPGIAPVF